MGRSPHSWFVDSIGSASVGAGFVTGGTGNSAVWYGTTGMGCNTGNSLSSAGSTGCVYTNCSLLGGTGGCMIWSGLGTIGVGASPPLLGAWISSSSTCTAIVSTRNCPSIGTASGISCYSGSSCSSSCITGVGALFTDRTLSSCSFVCLPPRWNRTRTNQLALPVEVGILTFVTTKPTNWFFFSSII